MDITKAIADAAERVAAESSDDAEAVSFLNAFAATCVIKWVQGREAGVPIAENAKSLVSAAWAFLGAASVAGLDLDSAFREMCLQTEERIGSEYLAGYERSAAIEARNNEVTQAATNDQEYARALLSRMFSNVPAFARGA